MEDEQSQHSPSSDDSIDMKNDLKEDVGLNTCKFCSQTFVHRTELSVHLSTLHTDRPLYRCTQCPLVFTVKRDLSTHSRVHSGESPHECTQCRKQFRTRQLLKKHCMKHTGERPHVCPHCGKAFFQKGHLTQHLMIHAGDRPHVCNQCSKTFIFKFDLNRHMKIHSERGHSCTKCRRSFVKQSSFDDHVLKCKGVKRTHSSTPSTPTNVSSNLLQLQKPLPLTPSSSSSLLPPTPMYSCMLCGQSNLSTSDLLLHLAIAHFPNPPLLQMPQSSPMKLDIDSPLSLGLTTPTKLSDGLSALFPIKTEEMPTVDTATNSSASSPQKASPMGSSSSPVMEERGGDETPSLSFPSSTKCGGCEDSAARIAQLKAALENTQKELNTANALLSFFIKQELTPAPQALPIVFSSLSSFGRIPPSFPFFTPSSLQSLLDNLQ